MNLYDFYTAYYRCNYLKRNPIIKKAIRFAVSQAIGSEARLTSSNKILSKKFDDMKDTLCLKNENSFVGLCSQVYAEMLIYGEAFVLKNRSQSGFKLQVIPSYMVPYELCKKLQNGGRIENGIEFNKSGRKVAIYVKLDKAQAQRVSLSNACHIYDSLTCQSVRGESDIKDAYQTTQSLKKVEESEQLKKCELSRLMAVVTDESSGAGASLSKDKDEEQVSVSNKGNLKIIKAPKGKRIDLTNVSESSLSLESFDKISKRKVCMALGVPYSSISEDYSSITDRSYRHIIDEYRRDTDALIQRTLINDFLSKVWRWHCLSNGCSVPVDFKVEFERKPFIHPLQDAKAAEIRRKLDEGNNGH